MGLDTDARDGDGDADADVDTDVDGDADGDADADADGTRTWLGTRTRTRCGRGRGLGRGRGRGRGPEPGRGNGNALLRNAGPNAYGSILRPLSPDVSKYVRGHRNAPAGQRREPSSARSRLDGRQGARRPLWPILAPGGGCVAVARA